MMSSPTKLILVGGLFMIYGYAAADETGYPEITPLQVAMKNASEHVEQAVHKSQADFENICPTTPGDFLTIFRYPPETAVELMKPQDVVETVIDTMRTNQETDGVEGLGRDGLTIAETNQLVHESGCLVEQTTVESCVDAIAFHVKYRSLEGTCNSLKYPDRGAAFQALRRMLKPMYEDDFSTPIGWNPDKLYNGFRKPNPRSVSTDVATTTEIHEHKEITGMNVVWGQFLAHDMQFTVSNPSHISFSDGISCEKVCENSSPCFPIPLPPEDRRRPKQTCLDFIRSGAVCGTGKKSGKGHRFYRQQLNAVSSYIDSSHIYGPTKHIALGKRDLESIGLFKVGDPEDATGRPLLPFDPSPAMKCFINESRTELGPCFEAGDIRANEVPTLTSLHTLWTREHNRIAMELASINPHWDADTVYYETRAIVQALFAHITYNEYLPSLFGRKALEKLGKYKGYKEETDSSASNVFATAALRFAHGMVSPIISRLGEDFKPIPEGDIHLHQGFFQPWRIIEEGGIDPLLRGLFVVGAKELNSASLISEELTEHLFETANEMSLDLHALDIQRGRDHALPGYNSWRRHCKLDVAKTFDDFKEISNESVRRKLEEHYGHPNNVDLFIGALLEDPVGGSLMGPTFECLLVEQFKNTRDGDRFWYENDVLSDDQLEEIKKSTLARVICDNTDIKKIQMNVFHKVKEDSDYVNCRQIPSVDLKKWSRDTSDNKTPILKCPSDIKKKLGNKKKRKIRWKAPTVEENMPGRVKVISTRESGDKFEEGVTKVTYVAVDSAGNCAICSFTITLE